MSQSVSQVNAEHDSQSGKATDQRDLKFDMYRNMFENRFHALAFSKRLRKTDIGTRRRTVGDETASWDTP
ncbi:hypothetical protein QFC20_005000 [Naganishia adeliensis]|uniref:Uncharacterized protein n=1 Tax=Naganishia adeliensis TaxID=92952 RepID=A0ACC2VSH7_9TREE|nr:hypothetical protein QFC20_005000 [Naganishia adeliensis]